MSRRLAKFYNAAEQRIEKIYVRATISLASLTLNVNAPCIYDSINSHTWQEHIVCQMTAMSWLQNRNRGI